METLSEYLKQIRQDLSLSVETVAKKTGASTKLIEFLEAGKYGNLPSSVYVKGFLKKLAQVYKLEPSVLLDQYCLENQVHMQIANNKKIKGDRSKDFFKNLILTPKNLSAGVSLVFVVFTLSYVIWQVLSIAQTPALEIYTPQDLSATDKTFVEIVGKTAIGSTVTVNDQSIFVDKDGKFQTSLSLSIGPKDLVIVATNRFRRSVSKHLTVIGQAKPISAQINEVQLDLQILGDVEVGYSLDGATAIVETYLAGEKKHLEAKSKILLSVSDASKIKAVLNGQAIGVLGREGEKLTDIPFSPQSVNINK